MASFDVIILGAGPGGYVCAIRCAQLGLKVAVVEGRETLGGTCLNIGCIPSKALLHASHMLHETHENFAKMGLIGRRADRRLVQDAGLQGRGRGPEHQGHRVPVQEEQDHLAQGLGQHPRRRAGQGRRRGARGEKHRDRNGFRTIEPCPASPSTSKGSSPPPAPWPCREIPKSMAVIGGGVIGLELGSVYARLGTAVTVIEYLDAITPGMDAEIAKAFQRILSKQGLKFILGAAVQSAEPAKDGVTLRYKLRKDDSEATLAADVVLVATGRKPYTAGLGLEALGVEMLPRGQIKVDNHFATNIKGIYAIGDAIPGPMLAHKAEDEGMAVAEVLAGKAGHVNYNVIPGVIYTTPEVANVGLTEEQLKAEGRAYKVGKFPFMGNARAKAVFQGEGFVKILADKATDRILGAHIIGPAAGDLIHEVCVAMEFGASAQDLALTCHAHPTFSEAVREAALACGDGAIHA